MRSTRGRSTTGRTSTRDAAAHGPRRLHRPPRARRGGASSASHRPDASLADSAGASSFRGARARPGASPRSPGVVIHIAMKRALRKGALRDCGQRCVYCAVPLDCRTATLDHVVPVARGGAHDPGNLVTACGPCNRLKGDLLPFEFFARFPWAGANFVRYARNVHRALKRGARRAVSLAFARLDEAA